MKVFYTAKKVNSEAFILDMVRLCGVSEPKILRTESGKPYLEHGEFLFNLTHTDGLCALAIGRVEVGIDAEKRTDRKLDSIKHRLTPFEQEEDFFSLWTAKEAYIKFCGGTLSQLLRGLEYKKGALHFCGAPVSVCLQHFNILSHTLCVCTEAFEEVELVEV